MIIVAIKKVDACLFFSWLARVKSVPMKCRRGSRALLQGARTLIAVEPKTSARSATICAKDARPRTYGTGTRIYPAFYAYKTSCNATSKDYKSPPMDRWSILGRRSRFPSRWNGPARNIAAQYNIEHYDMKRAIYFSIKLNSFPILPHNFYIQNNKYLDISQIYCTKTVTQKISTWRQDNWQSILRKYKAGADSLIEGIFQNLNIIYT